MKRNNFNKTDYNMEDGKSMKTKNTKYWISMTMGNIVNSRWEIIKQVFESLFKYHTIDIKWRRHYPVDVDALQKLFNKQKTKYWMSMTMGNIVSSRREILKQVFESLFKYHTIDIKWQRYYPVDTDALH